jgi:hypothetical protein
LGKLNAAWKPQHSERCEEVAVFLQKAEPNKKAFPKFLALIVIFGAKATDRHFVPVLPFYSW